MRLLYVIPYYLPALDFGGPVSVCAALAEAMSSRGHSVTVLTTDVSSRQDRLPVRREAVAGVSVIRLRNLSQTLVKANVFTPAGTRRALTDLLPEVDLVHVHEFFAWPCFRAATEAERSGRPVLLSGHGSISLAPERGRQSLKRIWHRLWGERTLGASTLIQAASMHEARHCEELGVIPEKIRIVPQGVRTPTDVMDGSVFRLRYEIRERPIFLFVGRLLEGKGVDLLLEAAQEFVAHPSRPLFVFVGPSENRKDLTQTGYRSANVLLTGPLHGDELSAAYRAASVFVLPSFAEGMPMTALEALSFGVPCLLSRACNLPEVELASAGLQIDSEVRSVTAGIAHMLSRKDSWPAMSAAARKLGSERFDIRRVHDTYEAIYQELVHG